MLFSSNNVILYRFLEQFDLLLLNKGIKRKFLHFLCLTISYILNCKIPQDQTSTGRTDHKSLQKSR